MLKPNYSQTIFAALLSISILTACDEVKTDTNQILEWQTERSTVLLIDTEKQEKIKYYEWIKDELYRLAKIIQEWQVESWYIRQVTWKNKAMLFSQEEYRRFIEDYEKALKNAFTLMQWVKKWEDKRLIMWESFESVIERLEDMASISQNYLSKNKK